MIKVDTREKKNKHILDYFKLKDIEYCTEKLDFGDYISDYYKNRYVIERKASICEFAGNCGRGHIRFKKELERCRDAGYKMIILIEEHYNYENLPCWTNEMTKYGYIYKKDGNIVPRRSISGKQIYSICNKWKKEFGCIIIFCDKQRAGSVIENIFRS